ncbi:UDP-Glycosyltransferase/glycogen phosphorylase [Hesseltinella vesiculosa]|uniref:UDP-Glycosyltransferase/glycogen phosphorylase n=1 Tax=Hesseltinella vesiculosa TaxID=101127 RepID=A0A1X2GVP5_9FUNG|nr:UDP-Glycosyltransferase/glycogen phosphorylase [Hesseltinella vesiculosa]
MLAAFFLFGFCLYASAKSIAFSSMIGGTSHTGWVLEITQVLADRGYNVTFVSRDHQLHLANHYPLIHQHSFGPDLIGSNNKDLFRQFSTMSQNQVRVAVRKSLNRSFKSDYPKFLDYFQTHRPDIVICDSFVDSCIDAAIQTNLPFVVTCTFQLRQDVYAPYINKVGGDYWTTDDMTLWERFFYTYVTPLNNWYDMREPLQEFNQVRQSFGLPRWNRDLQWANALRLVNAFYGLAPAQPASPLTQLVGPITPDPFHQMAGSLVEFFSRHKRVAYVAFGSQFQPNDRGLAALLGGILDQIEAGHLDAVVWAGFPKSPMQDPDLQVCHAAGQPCYAIRSLASEPWFMAMDWAPQQAILEHSSTVVFVTHGGAMSAHEALLAGKPVLCHPFKGDQPTNCLRLQKIGVARTHDRNIVTRELVRHQLEDMLTDNAAFQANLIQWKHVARINSRRTAHAANLIEEHMVGSSQGVPVYRHLVSHNLSWAKANDVDLHLTVAIGISLIIALFIKSMHYFMTSHASFKKKVL